jgi:hypothetical protein
VGGVREGLPPVAQRILEREGIPDAGIHLASLRVQSSMQT